MALEAAIESRCAGREKDACRRGVLFTCPHPRLLRAQCGYRSEVCYVRDCMFGVFRTVPVASEWVTWFARARIDLDRRFHCWNNKGTLGSLLVEGGASESHGPCTAPRKGR